MIRPVAPGQIVREARSWIGTPFRHQASLRGVGCDCLGLVRGVWRALFGPEPETVAAYAVDWAEASGAEALLEAAERHLLGADKARPAAGDVLVFRFREGVPAKHVGIATVPGFMVHAHDGACVAEVPLGPWARRVVAAYRFPGVPRP
jgi:NlpC/P60 family putative phage cell wall peptidase